MAELLFLVHGGYGYKGQNLCYWWELYAAFVLTPTLLWWVVTLSGCFWSLYPLTQLHVCNPYTGMARQMPFDSKWISRSGFFLLKKKGDIGVLLVRWLVGTLGYYYPHSSSKSITICIWYLFKFKIYNHIYIYDTYMSIGIFN